jgi:iron-sulfur cluster assembly protein
MLALTTEAQEAIEDLLSASSIPDSAGVRIAPRVDLNGASLGQLEVKVATVPAEADQVIDEGGARVFVDESATDFLDDKVLDANVSGEELRFAIAEQTP